MARGDEPPVPDAPDRPGDDHVRMHLEPSFVAGVRILRSAGVRFALAGRMAVWSYVPPRGQLVTKDVDFAVPYGYSDAIERAARESGFAVRKLGIGGLGIDGENVVVDFIDRAPSLTRLFADAVGAAEERGNVFALGGVEAPVVPKEYLVAMKLVPHEEGDERDVQELLKTMSAEEYREARRLVEKYLGYVTTQYLDALARKIGHAGPGTRSRDES